MSCAATTTIREALEETRDFLPPLFREPADDPTHVAARVALALDALALLEQLVEAAQAQAWEIKIQATRKDRAVDEREYLVTDLEIIERRADTLLAAVAAVGPGQELIVGKHPKTGDDDTVALHD